MKGDIFQSQAEMLVDPVNCVGVSGKGLAREFKRRFPNAVRHYERMCRRGLVWHDVPPAFYQFGHGAGVLVMTIAFVPTKKHWRDSSRFDHVRAATRQLARLIESGAFTHAAVPAFGCGNGGLTWSEVEPMLRKELTIPRVKVDLYAPLEGQ